jgi:hypothetical protein
MARDLLSDDTPFGSASKHRKWNFEMTFRKSTKGRLLLGSSALGLLASGECKPVIFRYAG